MTTATNDTIMCQSAIDDLRLQVRAVKADIISRLPDAALKFWESQNANGRVEIIANVTDLRYMKVNAICNHVPEKYVRAIFKLLDVPYKSGYIVFFGAVRDQMEILTETLWGKDELRRNFIEIIHRAENEIYNALKSSLAVVICDKLA